MTLLIAPFPVHVLNQPLMDTSEKLPATLHAWEPYHGESPAAICSANMFKAQELKGLGPLTVNRPPLRGESAKEQQPSFLLAFP